MLEENICIRYVSKVRYSVHVRKYKPLLHCTESLKCSDIEKFCLQKADEHNC